ncbi:unnamed protein product [Rotaria sp. Silwood2]|nr:unnamed protein product [Rotaria sp. Silwood2]
MKSSSTIIKNILFETIENPLNEHFKDNILSLIIKHYYHTTNDNDEYILICLQELSNRELIIAAVDIALIKCRSSRRSKAILGNFLERMNGDFIRLYHVLMFIVVDS